MHPTATALLAWYAVHGRALPWRRAVDPYRTWLAEMLLQQTRVETAGPYFARFTARWPTVDDLAAASLDEVLETWAGLGYYHRARALHAAARAVAARGGFPRSAAELRALPGVGPYTAAAIASIAFGEDALALDGNLARVGARLCAVDLPVDAGPGRSAVAAGLGALLPAGRAGDFNQALMDLGATVCLPRRPRCAACPVAPGCASHAEGREGERPVRRSRPAPRAVRAVALLAERDGAPLLVRRPDGGLLGGLWGPPTLELEPGEGPEHGLLRMLAKAGEVAGQATRVGTVVHAFTHQRWEVEVYAAVLGATPVTGRFARPEAARAKPLSRLAEKILALRGTGGAPAPPAARRGRPGTRPRRDPRV